MSVWFRRTRSRAAGVLLRGALSVALLLACAAAQAQVFDYTLNKDARKRGARRFA